MRKEVEVTLCLEDLANMRGDIAVEHTFQMIKQCIAAIEAKEGKVFGYRYSNIPDKIVNPCGTIATIFFDVGTLYAYEESRFELTLVSRELTFSIAEPAPLPSIWVEWKITLQKPTNDSKTK